MKLRIVIYIFKTPKINVQYRKSPELKERSVSFVVFVLVLYFSGRNVACVTFPASI